jgi:hypothetical protein
VVAEAVASARSGVGVCACAVSDPARPKVKEIRK